MLLDKHRENPTRAQREMDLILADHKRDWETVTNSLLVILGPDLVERLLGSDCFALSLELFPFFFAIFSFSGIN